MRWSFLLFLLLGSAACRGVTVTPLVNEQYPPHQRQVCIIEGPAPEGLAFRPIADVEVQFNQYGGNRKAKKGLAKQARRLGADAIINASFGNTMGAPEGGGRAIHFQDPNPVPPRECEWF